MASSLDGTGEGQIFHHLASQGSVTTDLRIGEALNIMKGPAANATGDAGSLVSRMGKPRPSRLAMIGCTIHSARHPQLNRGARLSRSACSSRA